MSKINLIKIITFPKRYHIDGYEIEIVECENCGYQLGFTSYQQLINRSKKINHWLDIISRGMKNICCKKPHYIYAFNIKWISQ